jgi:putative transposase
VKTFRYRLYPSGTQRRLLESTVETCRRLYNDCLAERKEAWEAEKRNVRKVEQLRRVKVVKATSPYAAGVHSHVLQVAVADLDRAFGSFFRRVKAGEEPGYPRFKGRDRFDSFGLKEYGNGWKVDGRRLRLSGIGRVAVRWHRALEGVPKTLRVRRTAGGWYACITCETAPTPLPATGREVGIDVGLSSLVATSDGEMVGHPRWYRWEQARLRVLQRRVCRRKMGGANRGKAVRVVALHALHVANRRKDFLAKMAHSLVERYDLIALEDLRIPNMVKNRHLAKSIMDSGWGYFRTHLAHKAVEAGRVVILVDPAYTSQTCSACGNRFPEHIGLSIRHVSCSCGLSLDRDINAARNILRAGRARWEPTSALAGVSREAAPL